jgi:uncharacterized SAM-binding protein YcdF (DUF218 family)
MEGMGLLVAFLLLLIVGTYATVPTHNCDLKHFDTILVLGCPATRYGKPSPEQRARVAEGVKEFNAGRAGHIIFSGGATEKQFVEGQVMAELAQEQGVPASAIVVEGEARNTIQNMYFSDQIMREKGWTSVEIISSPSHLPRAALIMKHYPVQWKEQASQWPPQYSLRRIAVLYAGEISDVFVLRWFGFAPSSFLHNKSAT